MPRNTPAGFIMAVFAAIFGFAMIWHIWLMAIAGVLGLVITFIVRSCNDDTDYYVSAEEVARTEGAHFLEMAGSEKHYAD